MLLSGRLFAASSRAAARRAAIKPASSGLSASGLLHLQIHRRCAVFETVRVASAGLGQHDWPISRRINRACLLETAARGSARLKVSRIAIVLSVG